MQIWWPQQFAKMQKRERKRDFKMLVLKGQSETRLLDSATKSHKNHSSFNAISINVLLKKP